MKDKIIEIIKSKNWLIYSNGRSTDYFDELDIDYSIEELIEQIKKIK